MTHHGAGLRSLDVPDDTVRALAADWRTAGLDAVDEALCAYAEKLTLEPTTVDRESVKDLRAHGLDDRAVHDACAVVAYFNFVTRIADGLGVELEGYWPDHERL